MENIIAELKNIKQKTDLNYIVKTTVEQFTEQIFSVLFDDTIDLEQGLQELELLYKKTAQRRFIFYGI